MPVPVVGYQQILGATAAVILVTTAISLVQTFHPSFTFAHASSGKYLGGMDDEQEIAAAQTSPAVTRPSWLLIAISIPSMVACLWFSGMLLAVGFDHPHLFLTTLTCLVALIGPGMVAMQQYLGTFRASPFGARFCMIFFGVMAFLVFLPTVFATRELWSSKISQVELLTTLASMLGVVVFLTSTSVMNYFRWKQLQRAEQAGPPVGWPWRFSLLEIMGITLAIAIVLGGTAFFSQR